VFNGGALLSWVIWF